MVSPFLGGSFLVKLAQMMKGSSCLLFCDLACFLSNFPCSQHNIVLFFFHDQFEDNNYSVFSFFMGQLAKHVADTCMSNCAFAKMERASFFTSTNKDNAKLGNFEKEHFSLSNITARDIYNYKKMLKKGEKRS